MTKKIVTIILLIVILIVGITLYFSKKGNTKTFNSMVEVSNSGLKLSCIDSRAVNIQIFVEKEKYKYTISDDKNEPFTQLFDGDTLYSFYTDEKQGLRLPKNCLNQTDNTEIRNVIKRKLMPFDPGTFNCKEINEIDFSLPTDANWIDGCQILLKEDNNPVK